MAKRKRKSPPSDANKKPKEKKPKEKKPKKDSCSKAEGQAPGKR